MNNEEIQLQDLNIEAFIEDQVKAISKAVGGAWPLTPSPEASIPQWSRCWAIGRWGIG